MFQLFGEFDFEALVQFKDEAEGKCGFPGFRASGVDGPNIQAPYFTPPCFLQSF